MKFLKSKIAILLVLLYVAPCVSGILFINSQTKRDIILFDTTLNKQLSMSVEQYITGVVAAEMPAEFEAEALKAQAVAARTYLVKKGECSNHPGCNICSDPAHCQAYISNNQLHTNWGNNYHKYYTKISKAVAETSDEIIVYQNEPISAVFHSTSSGRTENSEDVWVSPMPYLKSTDSHYDEQSPKFSSQKSMSLDEFKNTLISAKGQINFDTGIIGEITRTKGGSIDIITVGDATLSGVEMRSIFDLNSANFTIDISGETVTFYVNGYGHGVGMSQYGANFMAKDGYSYKDILCKYYTDVDIIKSDYAYNHD